MAQSWAIVVPMNAQQPSPLSVSVADAAAMTSFSQYEIREAINAGELPAIRRGRRIAILTPDLETWLRGHKRVTDVA